MESQGTAVAGREDRMWQFGVGLFLVIISPDSLFLTAVYWLAMGAAILIFGPLIGDWVDRTPRLSAARISLIVQNLSIAVCAAVVYFVIVYKSEIETQWPNYGLQTLCYGVIILIAVIAQLGSTGNTIAVEKDWIAEICGSDKDLLATTTAILKSIDFITNIVAPIATGQIMSYASTEIGAIFIGGWNIVSVFVEYYLLWKVYNVVPALRAVKDKCIIDIGYAYTQGINESIMGGLMAGGALVGILGTIIYPRMRKCIGQQWTGLFGLSFQLSFLTLCVSSVWTQGSPFDLDYANKGSSSGAIRDTNTTEFPPLFNTTTVPPFFNTTTPGPSNSTSKPEDKTWKDYISVGLLMTGIIGARCGLWMADLTITQLFLEAVIEQERGIVFGVQNSLNQLMDMLKFIMVIVAPQPKVFGLLVLISFAFVSMGYILEDTDKNDGRGHDVLFRKDGHEDQCKAEGKNVDNTPLIEEKSSTFVCRYVYISHFLSAWGARMWQFGAGLFLVIINPDSLLLTAVYGFVMGAAMLLFDPLVGDWVDRTPRLSAARSTLIIQNLSIALCSIVVYFVIQYRPEIESEWPNQALLTLCYAIIILISTVAQLASSGNTIAVEKDWIVEICGSDTDLLATTSAILKSIDLITNIVAPIVTGQIMAFASTEVGALFIGGWNILSVFVEYYLLWKVYNVVPALRAKKEQCRVENVDRDQSSGSCTSCMKGMLGSFVTLARGWRTFMSYDVAFAGLGLAFLFMTVLGFDNITVGFAYTQGVNESVMGALMASGAAVGILGTIIYPRLRKRVGQQRTGLYGLLFQTSFLTLCVGSVWAPGSPFDLNYAEKEIPKLSQFNITEEHSFNMTISERKILSNSTLNPDDKTWEDYISIGLLLTGIIGARCGLWMADLTITQLFLETVIEQERGIVFGVQTSLNQLMEMMKFVMVIIAPQPEVFGLLVLISFAFVLIGCLLYAKYSHSVRGHLFHAVDKLKALKHIDKNTLLFDNYVTYHKGYSDLQ